MGVILPSSSWQDVTARYPELAKLPNGSSPEVQANIIAYAEAYVHGKLSAGFSTPFSSNNYTARDLVIDTVYVQNVQSKQPVKGKSMADVLQGKFDALMTGLMQMMDVNGTVCSGLVGDPTWSTTQNYAPVFGLGDINGMTVNSLQLFDEAQARGQFAGDVFPEGYP